MTTLKKFGAGLGVAALTLFALGSSALALDMPTSNGTTGNVSTPSNFSGSTGSASSTPSTNSGTTTTPNLLNNDTSTTNSLLGNTGSSTTTAATSTNPGITNGTTTGNSLLNGTTSTSTAPTVQNNATSTSATTTTPTTLAPNAPTNLVSSPVSSSSISLSWTASTDSDTPQANLTYTIYRNGMNIATTSPGTTNYTDMNLSSGVTYGYNVSAMDPQGNTSPWSNTVYNAPLSSSGTSTPPSLNNNFDIVGWLILPSTMMPSMGTSTQPTGTTTPNSTTSPSVSYVNGYPMYQGNFIDCFGNTDNDSAHHSTDPNDKDPGHHIGQNCPGGAPMTPGANNGTINNPMDMMNGFMHMRNSPWVIIPLTRSTLQSILGMTNIPH